MADTKYLLKHHQTWVLQIKVPKKYQAVEGLKLYRESLHTGDLKLAQERRDVALGKLRERWENDLRASQSEPESLEWLQSHASSLQNQLRTGEISSEEASDLISLMLDRHLDKHRGGEGISDGHIQAIRDAVATAQDPSRAALEDVVTGYLDEIESRIRVKSWNQKKRYLDQLIAHHGGQRDIRTLDKSAARDFMQQVIHKLPVGASTKKTAYSCLNAFGQWCEDSAIVDNPFVGMGRTIKASVRGIRSEASRRPWKESELISLFAFEGVHSRYWKVWHGCALLLLTGARRGEILNAKKDAVVRNGKGLEVVQAKNEDSLRVIPLHPLAQPLVAALVERSDDEFLLPGYPISGTDKDDRGNAFLKQFNVVRKATTGIGTKSGLDLHSFRHTFETLAANSGIDQRITNHITGHANDEGTGQRVYLHEIEFDTALSALERLAIPEKVAALLREVRPYTQNLRR